MTRNKNKEFTPTTKITLAQRVWYFCSVCFCWTAGPSMDDNTKPTIWGEAGHINSVSEWWARFDSDISISDIRHISNWIWLCRNCHKKVDNNESFFSRTQLIQYKKIAEEKAWKNIPNENWNTLINLIDDFKENCENYKLLKKLQKIEAQSMQKWCHLFTPIFQKNQEKKDELQWIWEREILPIFRKIVELRQKELWEEITFINWDIPIEHTKYITNFSLNAFLGFVNEIEIDKKQKN